jgi:hypothetical protein
MKSVMRVLDSQRRRDLPSDVWSRVRRDIIVEQRETKERGRVVLLLAPLLLLGYKVAELGLARDLRLVFKLAPLLIAAAVFAFLKENPFKINMRLKLEGE